MKFEFNASNIGNEAISLGAGYGGIMLGRAAGSFIPTDSKTTERLMRGGVVVTGVTVAASVKSKDTLSQVLKLASLGVAISQADALVKDFASENIAPVSETSTQTDKALAAAFGLGCGDCSNSSLRALGNTATPAITFEKFRQNHLAPGAQRELASKGSFMF